ncbi:hypothetical protein FACS1894208_02420 [Clostridia bacterium]|nr:hypothetical protein FACS1894208_02420 [Clostridia bacterium]
MRKITYYGGSRVYHGSVSVVKNIELHKSKLGCDFGVAFYLTTDKEQAEKWAKSKCKRSKFKQDAIVNLYDIGTFEGLKYKIFEVVGEEWLDFVVLNRTNYDRANRHTFDVVIGPVADDDAQVVIDSYLAGAYNHFGVRAKEMALKFLESHNLKNQIALCTQAAVDRVTYTDHFRL